MPVRSTVETTILLRIAGWRLGCRAHMRMWRETQTGATQWHQLASASAWPRTQASRSAVGALGASVRPVHHAVRHPDSTVRSRRKVISRQVIAHMMPDLPNVGWERDLESFREFFENPAFRSDGLKVSLAAMSSGSFMRSPCGVSGLRH
jgi:hypothetical protein